METVQLKRVIIILEAMLEGMLIRDLKSLGARGYMVQAVRGENWRGRRTAEWADHHVQIEVFADDSLTDRILELLAAEYLPNYAVMAYVEGVTLIRSNDTEGSRQPD